MMVTLERVGGVRMVRWEPLTLGAMVRSRRLALGLTQQQLADRLNVDQTLISSMEREYRRTLPGPDEMARMADALETTTDDMMRDLGYIDRPDAGVGLEGDVAIFTDLATRIEGLTLPKHLKDALYADIEYVRKRASLEQS